ncbi:11491_t:CDS:2, partial [Scutellospora calospora]
MLQGINITNNKFILLSSNVLISISKVYSLPTQFLYNRFDVNRVEKFANSVSSQSSDEISKTISKKYKTLQKIINEISSVDEFNYNINNNSCIIGIQNPIERRLKDCSKSKRIANTLEKSDTKMNYEDSNYEELLATSTSYEYVREILNIEKS